MRILVGISACALFLGGVLALCFLSCKSKQVLTGPAVTELPWIGDRDVVELASNVTYFLDKSHTISRPLKIIGGENSVIKARPDRPNARLRFLNYVELVDVHFDGVPVNILGDQGSGAVRKCTFQKQVYPPLFISERAHHVLVDSCQFLGQYTGERGKQNFPGIEIRKGAHDIIVTSCEFIDNRAGITADGMDDYIENIVIQRNVFRNYKYYGVKFDVGDHYQVINNVFSGKKGYSINGIFFETMDTEGKRNNSTSGTDLTVAHNTFKDLQYALRSVGADNPNSAIVFEGNTIENCEIGILRSASSLKVIENTFRNGKSVITYDHELNKTGDTEIRGNTITHFFPSPATIQRKQLGNTYLNCIICLNNLSYSDNSGEIIITNNQISNSGGNFINIAGTQNRRLTLAISKNNVAETCTLEKFVSLPDNVNTTLSENYQVFPDGKKKEIKE